MCRISDPKTRRDMVLKESGFWCRVAAPAATCGCRGPPHTMRARGRHQISRTLKCTARLPKAINVMWLRATVLSGSPSSSEGVACDLQVLQVLFRGRYGVWWVQPLAGCRGCSDLRQECCIPHESVQYHTC